MVVAVLVSMRRMMKLSMRSGAGQTWGERSMMGPFIYIRPMYTTLVGPSADLPQLSPDVALEKAKLSHEYSIGQVMQVS